MFRKSYEPTSVRAALLRGTRFGGARCVDVALDGAMTAPISADHQDRECRTVRLGPEELSLDKPGSTGMTARRGFLKRSAAALAATALLPPVKSAFGRGGLIINITHAPYNASPAKQDNTEAYQMALNDLQATGGGILTPVGEFAVLGGLTYTSSCSLEFFGEDSDLSVIVAKHAMPVLSANITGSTGQLHVHDLGLAPVPPLGGVAGPAIVYTRPPVNVSGWKSLHCENVQFGEALSGYTTFSVALQLTNVWLSQIVKCNMHSNVGNTGIFAMIGGTLSVDNFFDSCTMDNLQYGFVMNGYTEGLHLSNCKFDGMIGLTTGSAPFNPGGPPYINVLGLYMTDCEFGCFGLAASLSYINQGWAKGCHFGSTGTGTSAVIQLLGTVLMQFQECQFSGPFGNVNPRQFAGISVMSAANWPSSSNSFDSVYFLNTSVGIDLNAGVTSNTGVGIRMWAQGASTLIGNPIDQYGIECAPVFDYSGNSTNVMNWIASTDGAIRSKSKRFQFNR